LKLTFKIISFCLLSLFLCNLSSCKKDKLIKDSGAKVEFSRDSVLFDTVFTTIGSATQSIRVRNKNAQRINISSIQLLGGAGSQFFINVDGEKGNSFSDIEIAANDSLYIFIQVNINPTNINSPLIVSDVINFTINGNEQKVNLEAWGQDAYYHRPDSAIKFKDGSYFPYSVASAVPGSYNLIGGEYVWKNDKPHVVYGYLVVDEGQKLKILEGTQVFMNYKAGIWVYAGGQIQILGKKDKEVVFQGARREKRYTDDPGQWDRIWINEGSDNNIVDYAIIKNAYIGLQCEFVGEDTNYRKKGQVTLTNTKIQNMSKWGLYCLYYKVFGFNNVISNCQEHSLNVQLGGGYLFSHCTFVNFWTKTARDKPAVNISNYNTEQIIPINFHMANCIVDGRLENEVNMDVKLDPLLPAGAVSYTISNSWLKTNTDLPNTTTYINIRKGDKNASIDFKDVSAYNFEPQASEQKIVNFTGTMATQNASLINPAEDIKARPRNTTSVTAGAYETK